MPELLTNVMFIPFCFVFSFKNFRLKASHTAMGRLRFLSRIVVAVVLLIGAMSTFMMLNSQHLVHETQAYEQARGKQSCSCSAEHSRTVPENFRQAAEDTTKSSEKRRSLVIFGDDRSGTTFLTRLFSEDPNVFSVYEPLWVTRDWFRKEIGRNLKQDVVDVVGALMSCNFLDNPIAMKFLASTSKKWAPGLFKNPFQSPPICNKTGEERKACPDPATVPKAVKEACSRHYKHSVTKVAIVRVPERKLSNIFPQIIHDNPDTKIRILHVVRDPRGSIKSRINHSWIQEYDQPLNYNWAILPRSTCEGIAQNVKFGASLEGSLKQHYKLVRYKDIASSPVKTAQEIYKFAGFEMSESLIHWIVQATNPSKEVLEQESKKVFSFVRNATANVEKWRYESPIERTRIIERECSELFDLLGLDRLT